MANYGMFKPKSAPSMPSSLRKTKRAKCIRPLKKMLPGVLIFEGAGVFSEIERSSYLTMHFKCHPDVIFSLLPEWE